MARWFLVVLAMMAGLCRLATAATETLAIYNGEAALPGGLSLGEWGGTRTDGQAAAFRPVQLRTGVFGIPIATLGRYQGTRFDFTPPLDTQRIFGDDHVYLELYLRAPGPAENEGVMPALGNLRFTFFTQKGIGFFTVPAAQFYPADLVKDGWVRIDLPLCRLPKGQPLGGSLYRLVLSADRPAQFLLGRLAVMVEMASPRVEVTTFPAVLETGQTVFFNSGADGGITPCTTSWDFDTAAGASVDATGNRATYVFTNPGLYLVTATVRDLNGERDPVTVTKEIRVTRPRN